MPLWCYMITDLVPGTVLDSKDLFRTRLRDLQPHWVGKIHKLGIYATHSVRILALWK